MIRPERVALLVADDAVPDGRNALRGKVSGIVYLGPPTHIRVELAGGAALTVEVANHDGPAALT